MVRLRRGIRRGLLLVPAVFAVFQGALWAQAVNAVDQLQHAQQQIVRWEQAVLAARAQAMHTAAVARHFELGTELFAPRPVNQPIQETASAAVSSAAARAFAVQALMEQLSNSAVMARVSAAPTPQHVARRLQAVAARLMAGVVMRGGTAPALRIDSRSAYARAIVTREKQIREGAIRRMQMFADPGLYLPRMYMFADPRLAQRQMRARVQLGGVGSSVTRPAVIRPPAAPSVGDVQRQIGRGAPGGR